MDNYFTCSLCAARFPSKIDLDMHMDVVHTEDSGEQSVSGSTPDPESDDDMLDNAHEVGEQTNETEEHPKEVDLGRDIDKSEDRIRTH